MSRYRYVQLIGFRDSVLEVEVSFGMAWLAPAADDDVQDIRVETVNGDRRPFLPWGSEEDDAALEAAVLDALDDEALNTAALEQEAARAFEPVAARARCDEGLEHVSGPVRRALTTIEESLK